MGGKILCKRCYGTGKVMSGGMMTVICPVCFGDKYAVRDNPGTTESGEAVNAIGKNRKRKPSSDEIK